MKRGMVKADKPASKKTGAGVAKTLLKVVGVGLAAGVALIAATDKVMTKAFPQDEEGEGCCCGGDCDCGDECTCGTDEECSCGCGCGGHSEVQEL